MTKLLIYIDSSKFSFPDTLTQTIVAKSSSFATDFHALIIYKMQKLRIRVGVRVFSQRRRRRKSEPSAYSLMQHREKYTRHLPYYDNEALFRAVKPHTSSDAILNSGALDNVSLPNVSHVPLVPLCKSPSSQMAK